MRGILGRRRRHMWSTGPKWSQRLGGRSGGLLGPGGLLRPGGLSGAVGLLRPGGPLWPARRERSGPRAAALTFADEWRWPVLPGAGHVPVAEGRPGRWSGGRRGEGAGGSAPRQVCACTRPDCAVPGAHPHDPALLAATTDRRMVDWWWTKRPDAPVVLATGGPVSAVSLPATAGVRALASLDRMGVPLGPVVATPTRCVLLVAPYSLEELG